MNVERSDEAKTAAALTSATPIIRAAADADVRRGARPAFSLASTPGVLNSLPIGQPISRVIGRAIVDDTLATPRKMSRAPTPASASVPTVPPGRTKSPTRKPMMPTTVTIVPPTRRRVLSASNPSSGRIAATGGTLAARRAGMITDASVMPTPTRKANRIVRGKQHRGAAGEPGAGGVEDRDQATRRRARRHRCRAPSRRPT